VIKSPILSGPFESNDILGLGYHAQGRSISTGRTADRAQISLGVVATLFTESHIPKNTLQAGDHLFHLRRGRVQ
jgi:hypothetical protein